MPEIYIVPRQGSNGASAATVHYHMEKVPPGDRERVLTLTEWLERKRTEVNDAA